MSYGSSNDADAVSWRLREAERARSDAERAHADALAQLRNAQRSPIDAHNVEQLQSRVRELEKKAALETVRCEELQLELSSALRARGTTTGTTWSNPGSQPASEIERIMAKIEQDNRILAELEHSRSTTHGIQQSGSNQALGEYHSPTHSPLPHAYGSSVHPIICQSNTMPTLSSLHATSHFTAPNSNTVYSMSAHNQNSYTNPLPTYSSNSYGLTNTHQVTFTNPVTAPLVSNIGQISNTLAGLHNNLHGITGNMSAMSLGSALAGGSTLTGTMAPLTGTGLTSCLNNVQSSHTGGLSSTLGGMQSALTGGLGNAFNNLTGGNHQLGLSTSLSGAAGYSGTGTYTNPLMPPGIGTNAMNMKIKPLDEIDLGMSRYGTTSNAMARVSTPVTPHQAVWNLGLENQYGTDRLGGIDPSYERNSRALARIMPNSGLEVDIRNPQLYMNGGPPPEGQVDMLDIPGKGRCCVYIARFSYEPPDIESAEGELSICAGDYLLVWGSPDPNVSMLDAELLDGRRGLVPANFVQRLVGDDLLEFHQAVVATLRDADETATTAVSEQSMSREVARLSEVVDISDGPEDDDNVPAPRQLTLERQLNKSVLIGWTAPEGVQQANIESYHVYVDGVLKTTVKATERTRALVEGVDSNRPHRISVRSVTVTRRTSRDAACTMVIGRDTANMGPTCVRASGVTCSQCVISWLPANSNHQHVVCVNNVEVRTVRPGVYRHIITGLSPSTQYRVTVRAKHLRAGPPSGVPVEEAPGAYTDFRTLPKGLPDPPNEIMVEAGPQDGTLLVTWQPVVRPPASGPVTGYAVFADGKKVTDVDSPTGDHALIDIGKLIGLNPKSVTVRTKSRDSQSSDSIPTAIPPAVLRGVMARLPRGAVGHPQLPSTSQYRGQQRPQAYQQHQQVIDHDENLSDKEIFPTGNRHHDPQLAQQPSQPAQASQQPSGQPYPSTPAYHGTQQPPFPQQQQGQYQSSQQFPGQTQQYAGQTQQYPGQSQQYQNPPPRNHHERGRPPNPHQGQQGGNAQNAVRQGGPAGPRGPGPRPHGAGASSCQGPPQAQRRSRLFVALFDYDPVTMSPNPESADEELPFSEGDLIKIFGDKDADGFYWGECRGRRGYVPHNMVGEAPPELDMANAGAPTRPRDRWSDAHASQPVRKMIALYDYDPQELSPNVDADAELSFQTGQIIYVYGEMDDDGFYMAEIDGVRGLVPSNFLADANDQYATPGQSMPGCSGLQRPMAGRGRGQGPGPGARGPPPPPRDNVAPTQRNQNRKADACPLPPSQLDHNTCASNPEQVNPQARGRGAAAGTGPLQVGAAAAPGPAVAGAAAAASTIARTSAGNTSTPPVQSPAAAVGPLAGGSHQPSPAGAVPSPVRRPGPAVVPAPLPLPLQSAQGVPPLQQPSTSQPNLMQKFSEMTAPGGDILSKGKELIFMKFGLGGK